MLAPDILNEDFYGLDGWTDVDTDTAVSEIDPAGQLRLDTNAGAAGDAIAERNKIIASPPTKFTIEARIYHDVLSTINGNRMELYYEDTGWSFTVKFQLNGLFIRPASGTYTEVGVDIVAAATWTIWRFQIDRSGGDSAATVEVFKDNSSQGTVDCDYETGGTDGRVILRQLGLLTDNMVCHVDYIRIATGLGEISSITPQILIAGF